MNLVLCGMMGSGKSTVGKYLASRLSYAFVDTDDVLESRFGKITDIFAQFGEEYHFILRGSEDGTFSFEPVENIYSRTSLNAASLN